jgi:DNA-binding transcriptional MocR family regulator
MANMPLDWMPMSLAPLLGNWTGGDGPLYRQLADRIDELVREGDLPPGARLPPERQLAEQLAVSRSTTVAAYALLADRGVVVRRQGSGTRITPEGHVAPGARLDDGGVNELFRPMLSDDVDVIDLASANRDCADSVRRALENLAGADLAALLATTGYTGAGLPRLRRRVAEHYTERDVATDSGHILVTNGAQQGLSLVGQLLVGPGDAVITEEATYGGVLDVFRGAGARLFAARSDENGVDPADLEQLVTRVRPALIYLVPTYNNPTGTVLPAGRRQAVVDIARRFHVPVVDDMVLSHLGMNGDRVPPPLAHYAETGPRDRRTDLVITVDSLAKIFWGGLRIGWVRAAPGLVNRLARSKTITDLGTSPVLQLVGARLLDEIEETTVLRSSQLRAGLEQAADLLHELTPDWEFEIPRGGQVLWIKLPRGTARGLAAVALRHGVRIATGPALSPGETFDDHIRIPFSPAPAVLEEGIRRLAAAWAAYDRDRDRAAGLDLDHAASAPLL